MMVVKRNNVAYELDPACSWLKVNRFLPESERTFFNKDALNRLKTFRTPYALSIFEELQTWF